MIPHHHHNSFVTSSKSSSFSSTIVSSTMVLSSLGKPSETAISSSTDCSHTNSADIMGNHYPIPSSDQRAPVFPSNRVYLSVSKGKTVKSGMNCIPGVPLTVNTQGISKSMHSKSIDDIHMKREDGTSLNSLSGSCLAPAFMDNDQIETAMMASSSSSPALEPYRWIVYVTVVVVAKNEGDSGGGSDFGGYEDEER
ncbi:hypothetical protein QVD17_23685 [Tagetes erecta]|uniref:Uncharacterized protein n=1 Tax=Tagetes erecta TaxID=13708 RepID=A0AAD8KGY4_TARER|nr:hypothetical protein QVD17_23685 [Tagetes erecta]